MQWFTRNPWLVEQSWPILELADNRASIWGAHLLGSWSKRRLQTAAMRQESRATRSKLWKGEAVVECSTNIGRRKTPARQDQKEEIPWNRRKSADSLAQCDERERCKVLASLQFPHGLRAAASSECFCKLKSSLPRGQWPARLRCQIRKEKKKKNYTVSEYYCFGSVALKSKLYHSPLSPLQSTPLLNIKSGGWVSEGPRILS
jgi:hypothetical protein